MDGGPAYESVMSGQQLFWICMGGIAAVASTALVPLIGLFWRAIIRDAIRDTRLIVLKAEMVRAGFTADDIERVVCADPGRGAERGRIGLTGEGDAHGDSDFVPGV